VNFEGKPINKIAQTAYFNDSLIDAFIAAADT
jgi:hypothetical protein